MSIPNNANRYLPPVVQIPSALTITAMSNANPMVITVMANSDQQNTYIAGQNIRLNIPRPWGMYQANGLTAQILAIAMPNLTLNINSINFDPFVTPPAGSPGPATIAPSGSSNLQFNNLTNNIPFKSFNDVGN